MRFVGLAGLLLATSCTRVGFTPPDARPRPDHQREAFASGDRGLDRGRDRLDRGTLDGSPDLGPCPGGCWIGGACRAAGAVDGSDSCKVCDPSFSAWAWGPAKGCVITVAGGSAGFSDGPALSAQFDAPEEIALDGEGRLYVADGKNHRIRILHRGQVTTLAGAGTAGWADGPAASALFNYPHGIATAGGGVVYVGEINGRRVRKIANGVVTTLAGDGTAGYLDGPALSAKFGSVYSLALVGSRLYLTDLVGSRVRWIEGGVVSTLAGDGTQGHLDGPALSARFDGLYGIAVDGAGRALVAEQSPGDRIRMIDGGAVSTLIGAGTGWLDGPTWNAKLDNPNGLLFDAGGRLYVADCGNARIRMVYQSQVSTIAGDGIAGFADGPVKSARFTCPTGIAIDSGGRLYIGDTSNDRIRAINP